MAQNMLIMPGIQRRSGKPIHTEFPHRLPTPRRRSNRRMTGIVHHMEQNNGLIQAKHRGRRQSHVPRQRAALPVNQTRKRQDRTTNHPRQPRQTGPRIFMSQLMGPEKVPHLLPHFRVKSRVRLVLREFRGRHLADEEFFQHFPG